LCRQPATPRHADFPAHSRTLPLLCRYSVFTVMSITVPAKITGSGSARGHASPLPLGHASPPPQARTPSWCTSRPPSTTRTRTRSCRWRRGTEPRAATPALFAIRLSLQKKSATLLSRVKLVNCKPSPLNAFLRRCPGLTRSAAYMPPPPPDGF
jgi:hypothetical protein